MRHLFLISISVLISQILSGKESNNFKITTKILNQKKAKEFNNKYSLLLPCHNYSNALNLTFAHAADTFFTSKNQESYILTTNIYGKTLNNLVVKKTTSGKTVLSEIWMTPLSHNNNGYIYLDNNKIVSKKYNTTTTKEFTIGKDISDKFDRHCLTSLNDTLYYFTTADYNRKKKLFGKDTSIVDFDFYEWNAITDKTMFLFSASTIVPDSMLVPELFQDPERGIYEGLDVYHWNWLQKTEDNKLLINFAYTGLVQVDLGSNNIDWFWGNNGHSFSKIKGLGDLSNPYYTHDLNIIKSGPYKGYYSYFENGAYNDSTNELKPAKARIFKINSNDNSAEIVFDKDFDISTVALGSIDVSDDYVVVNLGMVIPIKGIKYTMQTLNKSATIKYWKAYKHPHVYVYDLKGNEISNYTFPFAFFSYSAWSIKK